jgi:hypothetical protein
VSHARNGRATAKWVATGTIAAVLIAIVAQHPSTRLAAQSATASSAVPNLTGIFVDGRRHPEDPTPTWCGESIGHFEGDALVIDTIGYNDKWWWDRRGNPHTEQLHTIERWTRINIGPSRTT